MHLSFKLAIFDGKFPVFLLQGTISHYFNSSHCPICQKLTNQKICRQCKSNPQETIVNLAARIRMTERRHIQLTEVSTDNFY